MKDEGQSSHSKHLRSVTQKDSNRHEKEKEKEKETGLQGKRSSSGIASTWDTMKTGFHHFKSRIDTNRFIRITPAPAHDADHARTSSPESLDEIFERIGRSSARRTSCGDKDLDFDDDVAMTIQRQGHSR